MSLQHQQINSVFVKLVNIPGHSGILGNEMADRKAKIGMIAVGLMSTSSEISLNNPLRISNDIAHKSWERKSNSEGWDQGYLPTTARYSSLISRMLLRVAQPYGLCALFLYSIKQCGISSINKYL